VTVCVVLDPISNSVQLTSFYLELSRRTCTLLQMLHTCTVKDFYDVYLSVRCNIPDDHTRSTVNAMPIAKVIGNGKF